MKRTLIAISVACVGTLVAMATEEVPAFAPYETLAFGTNDWFEAKVDAESPSYVGGSVTQGEFTVEGEALSFDSKDAPVVFLTGDIYTQEFATVSLAVKASTIPNNGFLALAEDKIAVALYESVSGTATNFVARAGGEQFNLVGAAVPYEGDDYTLLIRFDNRAEGQKVAFAWADAEGVEYPLTNATASTWFNDYTVSFKTNQQMNVGFFGEGLLNDLKGFQLNIIACVVPTTNGTVIISKEDIAAFEADSNVQKAGGVDKYMASDASSVYSDANYRFQKGISVAQAYALGLIKTVDGKVEVVNDGAIEVKAASAKLTSDGLKVDFIGITPNADTGAKFKFKLFGSSDGTSWDAEPIKTVDDVDEIYIPKTEFLNKHFFKVVTEVLLKDAPAPQDN